MKPFSGNGKRIATMMSRPVAFVLCVIAMLTAWANDGVYYTRGNQLVPLTETEYFGRPGTESGFDGGQPN